jgi:mannose-6-phosphate isomerase-like protein (cupin superfamily)
MNALAIPVKTAPLFSHIDLGSLEELNQYELEVPALGRTITGKVFLQPLLGLTGSEISLNQMPAGQGMPFLHRHRTHEEVYIFLAGQGKFQINDDVFPVQEGSVVAVQPAAARAWRNIGTTPLRYVVVQGVAGSLSAHTIEDGELVPGRPRWEEQTA